MRCGAVLGLRWSDVDLDLGRLAVAHTITTAGTASSWDRRRRRAADETSTSTGEPSQRFASTARSSVNDA